MDEYLNLLTDPAHLAFELTLIFVFDVILGMVLYPAFKAWLKRHDKNAHPPTQGEHTH